ncbi:hypothetical protein BD779DRAFT_1666546 [Infundibulicybe gibba]|nr:hypothetical protein BD779DRAFT_1666546 [Infundibulicybe gibba]
MPPKLKLEKLLKEPFGPYSDVELLSGVLPSKGRNIGRLRNVWMTCNGRSIGFDESEFIANPPQNSRVAKYSVHFYGILTIETLEWLTQDGYKWLEADLRERDQEARTSTHISGLTLKQLYGFRAGEGTKLSVYIHCEKNLLAEFMTSNSFPNSFLIHAKERNRMFNIRSLCAQTLSQSRNFLSRFRLWAVIKEINKADDYKTPLHKRTIDYLVDNYLTRFRTKEHNQRIIFDPLFDSDVDEEGITKRPRTLRHIPRAQVIGMFAAQAEWLLAYQVAPVGSRQWEVDIAQWIKFCRISKQQRKTAAAVGEAWGLPHGVHVRDDPSEDLNLSQFGQTREFWEKRLQDKHPSPELSDEDQDQEMVSNVGSQTEAVENEATRFIYDSDFSEDSTPPPSESESETPDLKYHSLVARVPRYCWEKPFIPCGRFIWLCAGCGYTIDFLNLTEENLKTLPPNSHLTHILKNQTWEYLKEVPIQEAFYLMVQQHYLIHARENGVDFVWKNNTATQLKSWTPPSLLRRSARPHSQSSLATEVHGTDLHVEWLKGVKRPSMDSLHHLHGTVRRRV